MEGRNKRNPDSSSSSNSAFPVTVAIFACIYNVLVALSCAYLPSDPLYVGLSVKIYAWAGSVLSILGLAGIVLKKPSLITALAHFLLIDTFVSAVIRLLVLQFFTEAFHEESLCSSDGYSADEPSWNPRNFRHDIVTSVRWQKTHLWQQQSGNFGARRRCRMALGAVQIVVVLVMISLTVAQGSLAVTMRRHGKDMETRQTRRVVVVSRDIGWDRKSRRSPEPDPEKARINVL